MSCLLYFRFALMVLPFSLTRIFETNHSVRNTDAYFDQSLLCRFVYIIHWRAVKVKKQDNFCLITKILQHFSRLLSLSFMPFALFHKMFMIFNEDYGISLVSACCCFCVYTHDHYKWSVKKSVY